MNRNLIRLVFRDTLCLDPPFIGFPSPQTKTIKLEHFLSILLCFLLFRQQSESFLKNKKKSANEGGKFQRKTLIILMLLSLFIHH